MEIIIKALVRSFSKEGLTKQNVSNKLWTKGNARRTWLKRAEYVAGNYKKMQFS